jgi:hypothetical protein
MNRIESGKTAAEAPGDSDQNPWDNASLMTPFHYRTLPIPGDRTGMQLV